MQDYKNNKKYKLPQIKVNHFILTTKARKMKRQMENKYEEEARQGG